MHSMKSYSQKESKPLKVLTANIRREKAVDPVTTPASNPLISSQASSIIVLGKKNRVYKCNNVVHQAVRTTASSGLMDLLSVFPPKKSERRL